MWTNTVHFTGNCLDSSIPDPSYCWKTILFPLSFHVIHVNSCKLLIFTHYTILHVSDAHLQWAILCYTNLIRNTSLISWRTFAVQSLPLCLEWNNGSYFTPDNGDRRFSQSQTRLRLHHAVMLTESYPAWVNVFATVVDHRLLHKASCDPLFQSTYTLKWTLNLFKYCSDCAVILHRFILFFQILWIWTVALNIKTFALRLAFTTAHVSTSAVS